MDVLLDSLVTRVESQVAPMVSPDNDIRMTPVTSMETASLVCRKGDELGMMAEIMSDVDKLERRTAELSISTNRAYWELGRIYVLFCEVREIVFRIRITLTSRHMRRISPGPSVPSRTAYSNSCARMRDSTSSPKIQKLDKLCRKDF